MTIYFIIHWQASEQYDYFSGMSIHSYDGCTVVIVNLGYLQMAICNLCPFFFSVCNIFSEKEFENSTDKRLDEE